MAIEAPAHAEGLRLDRQPHLFNLLYIVRVTVVAPDTLVDMDAVVEVNEIRQIIQSRPLHRFARLPAFQYRRKHRLISQYLRVTRHTRLGRRNAREIAGLNRGMTITTIDAVSRNMAGMAERNGLLFRNIDIRHNRRIIQCRG